MMRTLFVHVLTLSLLFSSVEAATDVLLEGVPHNGELSHQEAFGHPPEAHDTMTDQELDDEHCIHCCHGHPAGITVKFVSMAIPPIIARLHFIRSTHLRNFAQAPPTPPPKHLIPFSL